MCGELKTCIQYTDFPIIVIVSMYDYELARAVAKALRNGHRGPESMHCFRGVGMLNSKRFAHRRDYEFLKIFIMFPSSPTLLTLFSLGYYFPYE